MLCKNMPLQQLIWKLPLRLALDAVAAWKNLFMGDGGFFIAVIKAHLEFARWCIFSRSSSAMAPNKKRALKGWLNSSIVWASFVQGKRKFSEIVPHKAV